MSKNTIAKLLAAVVGMTLGSAALAAEELLPDTDSTIKSELDSNVKDAREDFSHKVPEPEVKQRHWAYEAPSRMTTSTHRAKRVAQAKTKKAHKIKRNKIARYKTHKKSSRYAKHKLKKHSNAGRSIASVSGYYKKKKKNRRIARRGTSSKTRLQ